MHPRELLRFVPICPGEYGLRFAGSGRAGIVGGIAVCYWPQSLAALYRGLPAREIAVC